MFMKVMTTKSKNSESFYIAKSYINNQGKSTSKIIRKLGTLAELSEMLHTDRDGVMAWAREQAKIETQKYKQETEDAVVMIPFHSNRLMDYNRKKLFEGGYLFLQSIYYGLNMDSVCRKIKYRHRYQFDLNAILSDLIYTRILEPSSKASSFKAAGNFLETPSFIMTAQTTISRLNRKTVIKSMAKAKNTDRILLFRWDCLPMEMGFH